MDKLICGDEWLSLIQRRHGEHDVSVIRSGDEAIIVPLTRSGHVLLTSEPSPALGHDVLILPGGAIDEGEYSPEAANREMQEEVGCIAGKLDFLAVLHPWSKYLTVSTYVYLARDLAPSTLQGDEDYAIGVQKVPLDNFEQLIAAGRLTDARIIAALYIAKRFLQWEARQK